MPFAFLNAYCSAVANLVPRVSARGGVAQQPYLPINAGGLGGFPWQWSLPAGFNYDTFLFLNHVFSQKSDGLLYANDPLSTVYWTVLNSISFQLSSSDRALLQKDAVQFQIAGQAVVAEYQQKIGPIQDTDLTYATTTLHQDVATSLDFILLFQVAYVWSGQKAAGQAPILQADLLLPAAQQQLQANAPQAATTVIAKSIAYIQLVPASNAILDQVGNANHRLQALLQNTLHPAAANGGMVTVENDGTQQTYTSFAVQPDPGDILSGLQPTNASPPANLQFEVDNGQQGQVFVDINGQGKITAPADFFKLLSNDGTVNTLFSLQGTGSTANLSKLMPGIVEIKVFPAQYDTATDQGWFDASIIAEAISKGAKDNTGYFFSPQPSSIDFRAGGNFGLLRSILISQYPILDIHYPQGDMAQFVQQLNNATSWNFQMDQLPKWTAEHYAYTASVQPDSAGGFRVTFSPNQALLSAAAIDSLAYVIGGSVIWPGG